MPIPDAMIIICPSCSAANRVPKEKLVAGGKCDRCGLLLFRGQPVILTAANFDAHAAKSDIPLLVDFWATWCGPCKQMAPAFTAAAGQLEPNVRLGKVDRKPNRPLLPAMASVRSRP